MIQRVLQSKLLWRFALMMRRRHFEWTDQAYIRLIGKKRGDYTPYLRLSYHGKYGINTSTYNNGWYYRADGEVGEASYQDVIRMSKLFIKHDKLRAVRCI